MGLKTLTMTYSNLDFSVTRGGCNLNEKMMSCDLLIWMPHSIKKKNLGKRHVVCLLKIKSIKEALGFFFFSQAYSACCLYIYIAQCYENLSN